MAKGIPYNYVQDYLIEIKTKGRYEVCQDELKTRFTTHFQTSTKTQTNFSMASPWAYTSDNVNSKELEPKTRTTMAPVHSNSLDCWSRPSHF